METTCDRVSHMEGVQMQLCLSGARSTYIAGTIPKRPCNKVGRSTMLSSQKKLKWSAWHCIIFLTRNSCFNQRFSQLPGCDTMKLLSGWKQFQNLALYVCRSSTLIHIPLLCSHLNQSKAKNDVPSAQSPHLEQKVTEQSWFQQMQDFNASKMVQCVFVSRYHGFGS